MSIKRIIAATIAAAATWGSITYLINYNKLQKELAQIPAYQRMENYEKIADNLDYARHALRHVHGKHSHHPDGVEAHQYMTAAMQQLTTDASAQTNPRNDLEGMLFAEHQKKHADMVPTINVAYNRIPHEDRICINNGFFEREDFDNEKKTLENVADQLRAEKEELATKVLENKPRKAETYFVLGIMSVFFALGGAAYAFYGRALED